PQARRINTCVNGSRFIGTARHDGPDIFELLLAALGKLDTDFRLLPCLPKIIAITQKCAEEIAVIGGKQPLTIALIKGRVENALSLQGGSFDIPGFAIL